jgi:hypothetical protein
MKKMLMVAVTVLAFAITPLLGATGVLAQDAACDGADGGVDEAQQQATAPGRAGDNVPAGQVAFVISTVTDSNPEVPDGGCP